jgi:hypothetical protein
MASTLQTWYQRIYDPPPSGGVLKRITYQAVGVVAFSLYITVNVLAPHEAGRLNRVWSSL